MNNNLIFGDIPTTGEVIKGVTLPSTILEYPEPRYNASNIEDITCKQQTALWCNSPKEIMD